MSMSPVELIGAEEFKNRLGLNNRAFQTLMKSGLPCFTFKGVNPGEYSDDDDDAGWTLFEVTTAVKFIYHKLKHFRKGDWRDPTPPMQEPKKMDPGDPTIPQLSEDDV